MKIKPFAPYSVVAFMLTFVGMYGIVSVTSSLNEANIGISVVLMVPFSFVASYGIISLKEDIKRGGIRKVINKIKHFKDGEI